MWPPRFDRSNRSLRLVWKAQSAGSSTAPHRGKEDDFPDRLAPGEDHHEPVDPHSYPACGRHAVLQRADEVLVVGLRLLVALGRQLALRLEAGALLVRVVQLGEGIGELHAGGKALPALDQPGLGAMVLG